MALTRQERNRKKRPPRWLWPAIITGLVVVGAATMVVLAETGHLAVGKKATATSQTTEVTKMTNEKTTTTTETTTSTTASSEAAGESLAVGKNHSQAASAYAHDAGTIQQIIDGQVPYDGQRICFLTFDDGVNEEITPRVLDVLKEQQVPATFFVIGKTLGENAKPLLQRQIAEGHAIAMHSFDHDYDLLYPGHNADVNRIATEATKTETALQSLLGSDFHSNVWRYPGGHMSWNNIAAADQALAAQGVDWIDWNAMTGDAQPDGERPTTAQGLVDYQAASILTYPDVHIRVVLMHDAPGKNLTPEAIPGVVQFYRDHGYTFGVLE